MRDAIVYGAGYTVLTIVLIFMLLIGIKFALEIEYSGENEPLWEVQVFGAVLAVIGGVSLWLLYQ